MSEMRCPEDRRLGNVIERLLAHEPYDYIDPNLPLEAADEIERLRLQVAELRVWAKAGALRYVDNPDNIGASVIIGDRVCPLWPHNAREFVQRIDSGEFEEVK